MIGIGDEDDEDYDDAMFKSLIKSNMWKNNNNFRLIQGSY